jgi:hypothetical protein
MFHVLEHGTPMKPQDLYLALYFWGQELHRAGLASKDATATDCGVRAIASESGIPLASCHRSLKHLLDIGLISAHGDSYRANTRALSGILIHGTRYFFPVQAGALVRGIPTAHSAPFWATTLVGGENMLVWPHREGDTIGLCIEPLHPNAVDAALRIPALYRLLTVCDLFRTGGTRDIEQAKASLKELGGAV